MKLVTIATHSDGYFTYLKRSCRRFHDELVVLGWEKEWTGYSFKLKLIQEYMRDLVDDEILCFIDSFDVMMLRSLKELEENFRHFSKHTGARIAVGYDRSDSRLVRWVGKFQFGTCHGHAVNSGTYIGYVKDLRVMIDSIYSDPKLDDQRLMTEYASAHPNEVYVDTASLFFLTISKPWGGSFFDPTLMKVDDRLQLWYRGVRPFFAHGNGNTDLNELIKKLGYFMSYRFEWWIHKYHRKSFFRKAVWYGKELLYWLLPLILGIIIFLVAFIFIAYKVIRKLYKTYYPM